MSEVSGMDRITVPRSGLRTRSNLGWALGLLLVAGGVGGWFYWHLQQREPVIPAPVATTTPQQATPSVPQAPAVSLADGDLRLRELGAQLSASQKLKQWLAEENIVRHLATAVNMVAEGQSPRPVLQFITLSGDFEVVRQHGKIHPSARSVGRYDEITQVVTAIDAARAGQAYGTLRPFFQAAFAEFGRPGQSFDDVLHAAIKRLVDTPVPATEPELQEKGLVFVYAEPSLESLSPAQKQLLRMGTKNAHAIQGWLQSFERAIPAH